MRRRKIPLSITVMMTVFGVVFAAVGIGMLTSTLLWMRDAERTEGVVVELDKEIDIDDGDEDTSYHPIVRFRLDGTRYEFRNPSGSDPPAYDVGEHVGVAYDPADPDDAQVDSFRSLYLTSTIFAVIGLGMTTFAVVLLAGVRKRRKTIAYLRRHGREVWAELREIDVDTRVKINRRPLYYVRAVWNDPDTGRTYGAESDRLRTDPGPSLRGQEHVRVLYDPEDPNRNVVDVDITNPV